MNHASCGGIEPLAGINDIAEPDIDCTSLCIMVLLDMRAETSPDVPRIRPRLQLSE